MGSATITSSLVRLRNVTQRHPLSRFYSITKNFLPLTVSPYSRNEGGRWTMGSRYTVNSPCIGWGFRVFSVGSGVWDKKPVGLADEIMLGKLAESKEDKSSDQTVSDKSESADGGDKKTKEMPKWQKYTYLFFGVTFGGLIVANCVLFSLPDKDEHGNNIEDEFSNLSFPVQNYRRLKNKIFTTKKAIEEPFSDKLLPDPLEAPYYQPKYTVVLELTGLLVTSNWTHKHGWRFQKRPGLDIFLSQIGYPNFEVVVWTVENAMTFYPIINGMDPQNQYIMYRLFRDATRFKNGTHTKDLYSLNRDLKKVIVIDWNEKTTAETPENSLVLPKWTGENSDRALISLAQFLQEIKDSDVEDVREVLSYYKQFDDPIEAFRENQRKLEENMRIEEERNMKEKETSRFLPLGCPPFPDSGGNTRPESQSVRSPTS